MLGNEEGVLNIVSKEGNVTNITLSQGMIRHPPIVTTAGIISHLQTSSGSAIYLDAKLISEEGRSPAIPVKIGNKVFFGTSESISVWMCETDCVLEGRSEFHTNGEITVKSRVTNLFCGTLETLNKGVGVMEPLVRKSNYFLQVMTLTPQQECPLGQMEKWH